MFEHCLSRVSETLFNLVANLCSIIRNVCTSAMNLSCFFSTAASIRGSVSMFVVNPSGFVANLSILGMKLRSQKQRPHMIGTHLEIPPLRLEKTIEVVAVAHARRKPGYWKERVKN